jgi:hypothetical protein
LRPAASRRVLKPRQPKPKEKNTKSYESELAAGMLDIASGSSFSGSVTSMIVKCFTNLHSTTVSDDYDSASIGNANTPPAPKTQ